MNKQYFWRKTIFLKKQKEMACKLFREKSFLAPKILSNLDLVLRFSISKIRSLSFA